MMGLLIWGAPQWAAPTVAMAVMAAALVIWSYRRAPASLPLRFLAGLLKMLGFAGLAWCLVEPLYSGVRPRPKANLFVVLADDSQSMNVRDRSIEASRGQEIREQLRGLKPWHVRLEQDFDVRRYQFSDRLEAIEGFDALQGTGNASRLGQALATIGQRFDDRPLAGVLLFTDGNATDSLASVDWTKLGPVFPVISAAGPAANDICLQRVTASQTNFEASPVTVRAEVVSHGYHGKQLIAQLVDQSGSVVETMEASGLENGKRMEFRFQVRPDYHGVGFYQVRIAEKGLENQLQSNVPSEEATSVNNVRTVAVDRGGGPYRVLYVAGRPNWEYKFLRRALMEDTEVELVALLRMAKKQPKFQFRKWDQDNRNRLYKGFDRKDEDQAEQYHEPVLLRMGTLDEFELRDGFPSTADQLFRYDGLILDDLDSKFFTPDQRALIHRFVDHRGGGFLMLGGQESFQKGKYQDTAIGELLPVYLRSETAAQPTQGHRLELTRDGWLQPWARLRITRELEQTRLAGMPSFRTINRASAIKPGATQLLEAVDSSGHRVPALVTQRFGRGRSAALLIGDYWRWDLGRPKPASRDLGRAWRQTIRWLVGEVPRRVELEARHDSTRQSQTVELRVRLADEEFRPLNNANLELTVTDPEGQEIVLSTSNSEQESGLYTARYWPSLTGAYRARVVAYAPDESELGTCEVGWVSEPAADEFLRLDINRRQLETIARETGGEVIPLDELGPFVSSLPSRKTPITERWVFPLWHQWWILCLAITCLCGEWGLRRWKGLP